MSIQREKHPFIGEADPHHFQTENAPCTFVINTADSGPGSLRNIIDCASPGSEIVIDFEIEGEPILLSSSIEISKNLSITALSLGQQLISTTSNSIEQVIKIMPTTHVKLKNLQISAPDGVKAIVNKGHLEINNVTITTD